MAGSFKKALSFFHKGNYSEVIRILEPQIFRFRESGDFYYLLGVSCLFQGDIGAAYTYLRRAGDIKPQDTSVLLCLAMVHLHRQENPEALDCWLKVLEIDPKNRRAQRGLNFLKNSPPREVINDYLEEGKLRRLLPLGRGRPKLKARFLWFLGIPALLLILIPLGISHVPRLLASLSGESSREDYERIRLSDFDIPFETGGSFQLILTQGELERALNDLNRYLVAYRDNRAMAEINRILLSNAHGDIKNKVRLLESHIREPNFAGFRDNYTYQEIQENPPLYRGCFVAWKGRGVNIAVGEDNITFDFLVDYQDRRTLSGIVPVVLEFAAEVSPDFPMELLAEVIPTAGGFRLRGVSFHRLRG
ncbi:MAG: tetratricopeptide repeat protein [Spirochaetales bacterium]|jgi:tetratricopeptide (TPR) repeat protein|nr:tetratricopeptide repeat protein [Spirochaetales bacterium]